MSEQLNEGAALPPRGQVRWHRLISPSRGQMLRVVILGDTFVGQWTHYLPPTLPCTQTHDCHHCKAGLAPRYNGYAAVIAGSGGKMHVLALTYNAACQFTEVLKKRGTLRGLDVTLFRKFDSPRAPVQIRVEREIVSQLLPEAFDVMDSLARMWGINHEFLMRGCRRLGADESAAKFIKAEAERKANPGAVRVFKPDEVG